MSAFDFDDIRELTEKPRYNAIVKTELYDGKEINLYEGSFQCLAIGPDPDNNGRPTMWYTEPAELPGDCMVAQLRLFMVGHRVTSRLHHYIGKYEIDGDIRFVYLDRTRSHRTQQQEMREALRNATSEISEIVAKFIEAEEDIHPDNVDRDRINSDLSKLLGEIDFPEEGE